MMILNMIIAREHFSSQAYLNQITIRSQAINECNYLKKTIRSIMIKENKVKDR